MSSEELTVPAGTGEAEVVTEAEVVAESVAEAEVVAEAEAVTEAEAVVGAEAEAVAEQAAARTYAVVADANVRSGPGTSYEKVGRVKAGSRVTIACQRPGETVKGPTGTSKIWDRIGSGRYVSDTYVRTGSNGYVAPRC
ncbi:SH3 domain-containing protein [Streptomyces aureocirculatus]|uniref:SH3 domain-containing protein n=1 Tax=Streptomyces aureocirculatus TaxID=67275 RepID=UPI0004CBC783|nr:SH3 domain-containing protein [Streptomyces aureocirculatus]